MNAGQYPRNPNPRYSSNPEMAQEIADNPVFSALENEVLHDREVTAMRHFYTYHVGGEIDSQQTLPFTLLIEQGSDFKCYMMTMSAYLYDAAGNTSFPMPNSEGVTLWAGRGLSIQMTDTRSGRQLQSGFVPVELLATPGYGQMFQNPFPFRYFFYRNSKIRIDVRNRDGATETEPHQFDIAFHGYKIYTPE